jgi:hypothetical protein
MSTLSIRHHERVEGHHHPHIWHVYLHGRDEPIPVELPPEERESLDLTDDQIHDYLPTALQRHLDENRDDQLPGAEYHDASMEYPVRVLQTHFMA